jgi:hypothetical protein
LEIEHYEIWIMINQQVCTDYKNRILNSK